MPSLEEMAIMENGGTDQTLESGLIFSRLLKNPKTRSQALQLMKQNDASLNIPEVDIPNSLEGLMKPILDEVAGLRSELNATKLEGARKGILEDLVSEGLAENMAEAKLIEKFAVDEKIADYKSAAKFYRMSQTQATPTPDFSVMGGPMEMPADFKDIASNPKAWAQKAAVTALNDFRKTTKAA